MMLISFLRTIVLYILLVITVRMMGKRQIGEMEPAEFVVTMLIANLAAIPMQDSAIPIFSGIVPILAILGIELILSVVTMRSVKVRNLLCGKPVILIENGKILEDNLTATRVNLDELTAHLREKDIFDLSQIKYAILETNGQLSTLLYGKYLPITAKDAAIPVEETNLPITVISAGEILKENLQKAGRNENWVEKELSKRSSSVQGTLLMTVDAEGKIYHAPRENGL